jgi:hypothetical protein
MANTQDQAFRYVYSNMFSVQVGDNDSCIKFGIQTDFSNPESMHEQVAIMLTPRCLKLLSQNLSGAVVALERSMGTIALPQDAIDKLAAAAATPAMPISKIK